MQWGDGAMRRVLVTLARTEFLAAWAGEPS